MIHGKKGIVAGGAALFITGALLGAEPCVSGLQPGQRPGPYAFLVATGEHRGQSHCFVCETGDRPAVIVFARHMSKPLGTLLQQVDQVVVQHRDVSLQSWATFLNDDQPTLETKLVDWSRELGLRHLSLGVFEDTGGPPSYRLSDEADVTVLLTREQKVVANFAFRSGDLNDEKAKDVLSALAQVLLMRGQQENPEKKGE